MMEVDSGGVVQPRKRVRKPKNKELLPDGVKQTCRARASGKAQESRTPQSLLTDRDLAPVAIPRSVARMESMTCARCRAFNWIERRFIDPEPADKIPAFTQGQRKKVATTAELFSWNLSLAERSQRDSRSTLPTFKSKPPSNRRTPKCEPNGDISKSLHEANRLPVSMEPCTSSESPGLSAVNADEPQRVTLKPRRRRRNGITSSNPLDGCGLGNDTSAGAQDSSLRPPPVKRKGALNVPLLDSANCARICPLPAKRVNKSAKNLTAMNGADVEPTTKSRKCDGSVPFDSGGSEKKKSASNSANDVCHGVTKASSRQHDIDAEKQANKTLLAKRAMEELMKGENLAPIEMIVAEAISKDPLGFVHSLRDSKLLKSLEKLGQQRKLGLSNAESKALRKQRKKERKREKREKRKQKRLMRLAANCGVSIEQLELEMSLDRSDSRGSAPRSSPLSLNGSLLGSSGTPAPSLLANTALSNLPGPSPASYLNVFPRPSFVPDPLNPLRNLAADRADSSGTGTPNADGFSPLILPPPPIPTPNSNSQTEEADADGHGVEESPSTQSVEKAAGSPVESDTVMRTASVPLADESTAVSSGPSHALSQKMSKDCEESNGATPEDEEDEQNAIAISHLFPQLDALQQLKLIQMCTDNESIEGDEHRNASSLDNANSSSKVARTIALIKGKVKEFKETGEVQQAECKESGKETADSQEDERNTNDIRVVRVEEEEDVDVEDVRENEAFLDEIRKSTMEKRSDGSLPQTVQDEDAFLSNQSEDPQCSENSDQRSTVEETHESNTSNSAKSSDKLIALSDCITGMADMGFGLQPRMLSILDEPLTNSTPEHAPHRTTAVVSEVPLMEDDEHIYTTEMKVIPDWFNHAPYGAGTEAHIRYWEGVKQRVLVADWIRKLQQHRSEHMLNHTRSRLHSRNGQKTTAQVRRSKSTEPWWPRNLYEQYENALDIAGKVMRSAETPFGAYESDVPLINNVPIKVIRLDDDDTATLAYFRPGSPLTVSDPTEDYQIHVLAQDLDDATVVPKGVVQQMGIEKDDEKLRYLPWMKVKKVTPERSLGNSTRPSSRISSKSNVQLAPPAPVEAQPESETAETLAAVHIPEETSKLYPETSNYSVFSHKAYPVLKQPAYNAMLMLPPSAPPQISQQMPLLPQQYLPTSLPPLSTVLDGLQPSTSGLSYLHMPQQHHSYPGLHDLSCVQQAVKGHSVQSGYSSQISSSGQMLYGSNDMLPGCRDTRMTLQDFASELNSSPHQANFSTCHSSGLTKDTIIDQEMEDFFCAVFDECQMRSSARVDNAYMEEDADPFLTMEQLT